MIEVGRVGQVWRFGQDATDNWIPPLSSLADPRHVYFGDLGEKFPDLVHEFSQRIEDDNGLYVDGDDDHVVVTQV